MFNAVRKKTTHILLDWLIALLFIILVLWFAFTLPILSFFEVKQSDTLNINHNDLKSHVEVLSYFYAPRTMEFGNLNATASYIHSELSRFGNAQFQPYWTLTSRYKNVVLSLGPMTEDILVIGAHYDAKSASFDVDGNASGVATLIELAHQLSKNEDKLSIGIQLVAYPLSQKKRVSLENMGSYQHIKQLELANKTVKLMLSLDGVGRYTDDKDSQKYPYDFMHYVYPDKGNYISLIGRLQDYSEILQIKKSFKQASNLPIYSFSLPASKYMKNSSDHHNYQQYGFPAMMVTDTSEYRNRSKGSIEKPVSDRLDYEKMAMLVQGLYQVIMDSHSDKPIVHQTAKLAQETIQHDEGILYKTDNLDAILENEVRMFP